MEFLNLLYCVVLIQVCIYNFVWCPDPRNQHGSCSIRINEVVFAKKDPGFVEVAKVCPKNRKFNSNVKLTGFAILIIKASQDNLKCKLARKITKEVLKAPVHQNDRSVAAAKEFDISRGVKHVDRQGNVESRQPAEGAASEFATRQQANYDIQSNSNLFFVLKSPKITYSSIGFTVVILLHMHSLRMKNSLPCRTDERLSKTEMIEIKDNLHDFVILYSNDEEGSKDILKPLVSENTVLFDYTIQVVPRTELVRGYSKCDQIVTAETLSKFKFSPITEGRPNMCKQDELGLNEKVFSPPFKFQGIAFDNSGRKLIINLLHSLKNYQYKDPIFNQNPIKLTASLLNVAESTVSRFENKFSTNSILDGPKKRKAHSKVMDAMDDTKRELLYKSITSFYAQNKVGTIPEIHTEFVRLVKYNQLSALQQAGPQETESSSHDELFTCSIGTFRKVLKSEGYKFGKIALRDSVVFEPKKILWRRKYLAKMRENRKTNEYDVLYIDETWIDPHQRVTKGITKKCYKDFTERKAFSFEKHKVSRGGRILILAAGGRNGFINKSNLVWKVTAKKKTADFHDNMDRLKFQQWITELMENVKDHPKKYIFVIDNAPYHTSLSAPLANANKREITEFLKNEQKTNGLELPLNFENLLYVELKQILRQFKEDTPRYKIDDLVRAKGHQIVRIPPYNCELNPIEFTWKDIKLLVKKQNVEQNIDAQVRRAKVALDTYSVDLWNRHIDHVERLEQEYFIGDQVFDDLLGTDNTLRDEANQFQDDEERNTNLNEAPDDNDSDSEAAFTTVADIDTVTNTRYTIKIKYIN